MVDRPRVALCLYGRFNNRFSQQSGREGAAYIKKAILQGRDVDVYIFSQDLANESTIRSLYEPETRRAVFEELPDFSTLIADAGIDESMFSPMEGFRTVANSLAFFYTRSRSLGLLREAIEAGACYDSAICCRFDLGQLDRIGRRRPPYAVSEINFHEGRDMSLFYSAMWNQLNMGFGDQWFYSSPEQLLKLEDMYTRAYEYFRPESDYLNWLASGITDSNRDDALSNEVLKPSVERTSNLDVLNLESAVHNHLLHKYFAIEQGLYERSEFVSDFEDTAHVLYTHSSYSDIWPIYFGQQKRYFQGFARNYVFIDKYSDEIPADYVQIVYDDSQPYVDRLQKCLSQVAESRFFFDHEDMFLVGHPDIPALRRALSRVKPGYSINPARLDFVRLVRGGLDATLVDPFDHTLHHLLPWSRWHFSIQPSFWLKSSFLRLLSEHPGQGIWDFENSSQRTLRRLRLHGATLWSEGLKRGNYAWDNPIYPYVATAVSQGKWTISEFEDLLPKILAEYRIDVNIRGQL